MEYTYEEAADYIARIPRFTSKNSPEDTRLFYEHLGCPGEGRRVVHVAGTNGKGSVCAYVNSVLCHAGLRTGFFSSPHLVDVRERFRLNGELMPEEEFAGCFNQVMEECFLFREKSGKGEYHPTFFELLFFMGMIWFEQKGVQAIVLETGLGGRLDATNVLARPAVCVITRIGLDHMEYLGETKPLIAAEKAGIIKPGVPVVCWEQEPEVNEVIARTAQKKGAERISVSECDVLGYQFQNKTVAFSMHSEYYEYIRVCLHTSAVYQRENAALAVRALEALQKDGLFLTRAKIEEGLSLAHWEGRMEELLPGVTVDGAHNEDGIEAFLDSVRQDGCKGRRYLLFSVVSDKRAAEMAERILSSGLFDEITATSLETDRRLGEQELMALWKGRARWQTPPEEAFVRLIREKGADDRVYAAGSLYLAGQLLAWYRDRGEERNAGF